MVAVAVSSAAANGGGVVGEEAVVHAAALELLEVAWEQGERLGPLPHDEYNILESFKISNRRGTTRATRGKERRKGEREEGKEGAQEPKD